MNRGWWGDKRPAHLRPVVGWWAYHYPRLTFYRPGQCAVCKIRGGTHKMDCPNRGRQLKPTPGYVTAGFILFGVGTNFGIGYILANWMPNTVGLWAWALVSFFAALSFNFLLYRVFRDWQRVR